ncbi:MAG: MarC family protein [Anaerolineae bacterium]
MSEIARDFYLTFVPLFIVIDAFGNLPFVISLSSDLSPPQKRRLVHLAILTATALGLIFLFFGQFILNVLNIDVGEFAITGGLILLILSLRYMSTGHMMEASQEETIAIIPIGTPLTVGPATITTLLLLAGPGGYPLYMVLISFVVNMAIAWVIFLLSERVASLLGHGGLMAISRVFSLLLAAIGVSMIVRGLGLTGILKTGG